MAIVTLGIDLAKNVFALPLGARSVLNGVVDANYLGRPTTTILAGRDRCRAGPGGGMCLLG